MNSFTLVRYFDFYPNFSDHVEKQLDKKAK